MTKTYLEVLRQIKTLEAKADELRKKETADVIERIREAITIYELTAADLGFGKATTKPAKVARPAKKPAATKTSRAMGKAPIKFRDTNGNTWTGRGSQPHWLRAAIAAGATLESLRA